MQLRGYYLGAAAALEAREMPMRPPQASQIDRCRLQPGCCLRLALLA